MPTIARITCAYALGIALTIGLVNAPATTFVLVISLIGAIVVADETALLREGWPRNLAFLIAGVVLAYNAVSARQNDCRNRLRDGATYNVRAVLLEEVGKGSTPISLRALGGAECHGTVRMLAPRRPGRLPAGSLVRITGTWSRDAQAPALTAGAGILVAREVVSDNERAWLPAARGRIVTRIRALFGAEAPLAEALLVAQQGGIDPDVKQ